MHMFDPEDSGAYRNAGELMKRLEGMEDQEVDGADETVDYYQTML